MTQERSCGTCTKCCDGWLPANIYGQEVEIDSPCRFVKDGGGCNIYACRPEVCSSFKCAWLADPEVPDWIKPETSGVISFVNLKRKKRLIVAEAGSAVTEEYRTWAKAYSDQHALRYIEEQ